MNASLIFHSSGMTQSNTLSPLLNLILLSSGFIFSKYDKVFFIPSPVIDLQIEISL